MTAIFIVGLPLRHRFVPAVARGAVIVLGAVAGSRFSNTGWRTLVDYLGAALGSFAVAIVCMIAASMWRRQT